MTLSGQSLLLHPVALASILVLVINDHVFKPVFGGWWTGKLSDVAGMIFFPLFLMGLLEIAARRRLGQRALLGCIVATGLVFGAIQVWGPAGELYRWGLGVLQWPVLALTRGYDAPRPVGLTPDPTDLLALPALGVAWWIGRQSQ